MTFSNAPGDERVLRTAFLPADYAGEQDHALIELSDFLPIEKYK